VGGRSQHELSRWEIVELRGLTHHEAAETLREACLFVNLNCFEAFNTTVPEAMAAGAVPVCYEAYGGRDFLRDGDNAFVFPNNSLLPLIERVVDLMAAPEPEREARLVAIRQRAWETAARYTPEATAVALREFFDGMGR
jgi:glycosyltransferase involved in cell wall biosynthesis